MDLIDRSRANGIAVKAWTFDENYARNGHFLDGLDARGEAFIGEVPPDFHAWLGKPKVLRNPPKRRKRGRQYQYPRLARRDAKPREVRNLAMYSPSFTEQRAQRYRVKDNHKGPEVWEICWHTCWRKAHHGGLISNQCTLIVAKHVLSDEVKYFLSNRVPGRDGWTVRELLRIAFGRWPIEACFRESKEELGWDHFECRGWQCIHRHLYVTILSQLFCARVRQRMSPSMDVASGERLTLEQVRRAANVFTESIGLSRTKRQELFQQELDRQQYYQSRNATASKEHRKRRYRQLRSLGIDPDRIKSVHPKDPSC